MPGQDFDTPSIDKIKDFFENEWLPLKEDQRKAKFIEFMNAEISEAKVDDSLFIMAGVAAPAAAIVVKRSSESIPQIKKFRPDIIPNVFFVPLFTLAAIMGATAVQMHKKSKAKPT